MRTGKYIRAWCRRREGEGGREGLRMRGESKGKEKICNEEKREGVRGR
jgi:hypothetical protein